MLRARTTLRGITLEIVQGDLTNESVEAIVNAANQHLAHAGGVAAAIVQKGGRIIQEKSDEYIRKHGSVPTGTAVHTEAGKLKCKFVIHTVGPVWRGHKSEDCLLLKNAVINSYNKAEELSLSSIALPAISSGIFGFPKELCAKVILSSTMEFIETGPKHLSLIKFVNYDSITSNIMKHEFESIFGGLAADEEEKVLESKAEPNETQKINEALEQLKIDEKMKVDESTKSGKRLEVDGERKEEEERKLEIKQEIKEVKKEGIEQSKKVDPAANVNPGKKVVVESKGRNVEESKPGKKVGVESQNKKVGESNPAKISGGPVKGTGNLASGGKKAGSPSVVNKTNKK